MVLMSELYFIGDEEFREKDMITEETLINFLKTKNFDMISTLKHKDQLHIKISSAVIKILLSSLI